MTEKLVIERGRKPLQHGDFCFPSLHRTLYHDLERGRDEVDSFNVLERK
jgi:hypothetical protein